jgi:hypothetical protein
MIKLLEKPILIRFTGLCKGLMSSSVSFRARARPDDQRGGFAYYTLHAKKNHIVFFLVEKYKQFSRYKTLIHHPRVSAENKSRYALECDVIP